MKKLAVTLVMLSVFTLLLPFQSWAQRGMQWRGGGGWEPTSPYGRLYDPKTVQTISGEVTSIEQITPFQGMAYGVHLLVKTDKETLAVHLGPAWYIENQETKIQPGDQVEVRGSRINFQGKPAIIAAEVKKGDQVLQLRDEAGVPAWSGWRRR